MRGRGSVDGLVIGRGAADVLPRAYVRRRRSPMNRRTLLAGVCAMIAAPAAAKPNSAQASFAASPWRKLTAADWRKRLSPAAYKVLREEDTEAPGSSPLNREKRRGTYVCAGCELPLFKSEWK